MDTSTAAPGRPFVSAQFAERERFVLRPGDFSLSDEQETLRDVVRTFLEKSCTPERVRAAEPLGWDADLWSQIAEMRLIAMGLPETSGGDGAGLVELAIVAEELGRAAAPAPFVESVVAGRLLARLGAAAGSDALAAVLDGAVVGFAIGSDRTARRLVPGGAVATVVVGRRGDDVVLVASDSPPAHVPNLASAPLAWWDLTDGEVLASGEDALAAFATAEDEWRLLTAAALIGAGESALALAAQYARDRVAFGVPIGTFQAVAHPLADAATGIDSGRRLVHKAAWYCDNEPEEVRALVTMAFVHAAEASEASGSTAIRTQGGFGFMLESDVQLFYRRAKGWALCGGDRRRLLARIADDVLGPVPAERGEGS